MGKGDGVADVLDRGSVDWRRWGRGGSGRGEEMEHGELGCGDTTGREKLMELICFPCWVRGEEGASERHRPATMVREGYMVCAEHVRVAREILLELVLDPDPDE